MTYVQKLVRIQLLMIALFAILKFTRPGVLESNAPGWIKLTLLSLPNFFESVIGTLVLTAIGCQLNDRLRTKEKRLKKLALISIATFLTGLYVITQELKIHNLGGNNVYDFNDIIGSLIGLFAGFVTVKNIDEVNEPTDN